ncbi:SH3 domain-containing protein [Flavobacterium sp.]|uniref:SH3 domain-containing protein n=1 Tax=Flavobacterium sp. TaxID=239 RepID=UPI004047C584
MKKRFIYLLFFLSFISNAQKRYWIVNDTRLFEKPSLDSNFHGYFKYGASIEILSDDESGWIKVKADNNDIGFIKKKLISTSLNASDKITVDIENPIIKGGDSYYGGNHLFVLVAGLKLRTEPNSIAKIGSITTAGMPVSISYIPLSDEEWVCVNNQFTLRKFIGNRPNLESLYEEFNKIDINNIKERKKISERIVELAWNTGYKRIKSKCCGEILILDICI